MKFDRILDDILLVVCVIVVAYFSWQISGNIHYSSGYDDALASIKPDTVYVDNTIHYDEPVPDTIFRDTGRVVYVQVPVTDSTGHVDTTAIALHPEVRQFADPERAVYELQISGIEPRLDWITVHQHTEYINVPVPQPKYPSFVLSPAVGGYVLPGGFGIAGGLELDYWRGRWQFSAEGGYGVFYDFKRAIAGPYGQIGAKYNLIRK
jgi:hypothetical protein